MEFSHLAFSDDSGHEDGRYNSLGLITLPFIRHKELRTEFGSLLFDSGIKNEFKWQNVYSARYKFAVENLYEFIFSYLDELRIDVLIWDMEDSRHKGIIGRDDNANLCKMYYHLLANVLRTRWSVDSSWLWKPDKQSSINWRTLGNCLVNKKYRVISDLFGVNEGTFLRLGLKRIQPTNSEEEEFIQIADYFAGMGAYSYGHFEKYKHWLNLTRGQSSLFDNGDDFKKLSGTEETRFPLLESFINKCKKFGLKISLEKTGGLRTHDPKNHVNFWIYQPQHIYDKAPTRSNATFF